jgi:hypothetical protein
LLRREFERRVGADEKLFVVARLKILADREHPDIVGDRFAEESITEAFARSCLGSIG